MPGNPDEEQAIRAGIPAGPQSGEDSPAIKRQRSGEGGPRLADGAAFCVGREQNEEQPFDA